MLSDDLDTIDISIFNCNCNKVNEENISIDLTLFSENDMIDFSFLD